MTRYRRSIAIASLLLSVATIGFRPDAATGRRLASSGVLQPHSGPVEETYRGCPPRGWGGDPDLNLHKNRIDVPTHMRPMTMSQFLQLTWPRRLVDRHIAIDRWPAHVRRHILALENTGVSLTGYIVLLAPGLPEATNCYGLAGFDQHVFIARSPNLTVRDAVITETTPRMRALLGGFDGAIDRAYRQNLPVRISGWLMLDTDHPEAVGVLRATLWEIHPITQIEVLASRTRSYRLELPIPSS